MDYFTEKALSLKPLYEEMLNDTFDNPDEEHVKFCIQWGKQFPHSAHEGLIFVGRANNGWMCFNSSAEDIFNPNNENRAFSRDDQMIWVENNIDYSSTSAFWRVIRKTSRHFFPNNELMHIAWSNLYKIAPDVVIPIKLFVTLSLMGA